MNKSALAPCHRSENPGGIVDRQPCFALFHPDVSATLREEGMSQSADSCQTPSQILIFGGPGGIPSFAAISR